MSYWYITAISFYNYFNTIYQLPECCWSSYSYFSPLEPEVRSFHLKTISKALVICISLSLFKKMLSQELDISDNGVWYCLKPHD